ncbi:MAG: alpha/beta hydrolase [Planctomycetaceae bacterium]|jgi:pimeloyl-ACP methyl ester carboxylesterase|nr:alpha/beta hydrolase [Planctomycetaceae bacterium]
MKRFVLILTLSLFVSVVRAGDTWLIDTHPATAEPEHFIVKKLNNTNQSARVWHSTTWKEFQETHVPQKPLVIVIHGNWMSVGKTMNYGIIFDRLTEKFEKFGEYRLLIWSWPAERIACGIRKDALIKARRADDQAQDLVTLLQTLKPNSKVSLIGFSFGARLVCNTLQILANSDNIHNNLSIRSILLAGALDCGALTPNGHYGQALSVTEKMLIHVNPDDQTLCFYPLLFRVGSSQAIGKKGVALNGISEETRRKIKSVNVARQLGTEHAFIPSFRTLILYEKDFRQYALFE